MSNPFHHLKHEINEIRLTGDEKSALRQRLLVFMQARPSVRKPIAARHIWQRSPRVFLWTFIRQPMPILLLILVLAGGGVSFAAENTLPGDALYPIKVHVNENMRAFITVSDEGDVAWDIRRMERRLQEAETLAVEEEFNAEVRAQLEERFDAFAARVEEQIARLRAEGREDIAARLSSNLEAALRAHERILAELATDDGEHIAGFAVRIGLARQAAVSGRSELEAHVSAGSSTNVQEAAEGRLRAAEYKIAEVTEYLAKWEERLGASATAQARARLEVAEKTVADGKVKLEAGAYGEAFVLFQQAHRIAQEAKLLLEARKELNIEVSINVDDDDDEEDGEDASSGDDAQEGDEEDKENEDEDEDEGEQDGGRSRGRTDVDALEGMLFRLR